MVDTEGIKKYQSVDYQIDTLNFVLPNQGSNLDFTDPESVVLPITPLGICIGCKNTIFLFYARKIIDFLGIFLFLHER